MVEISEEELIDLDHLADGLSEVRKYKSKDKTKKAKDKKTAPPPITEEQKAKKQKKRCKTLVRYDSVVCHSGVYNCFELCYGALRQYSFCSQVA